MYCDGNSIQLKEKQSRGLETFGMSICFIPEGFVLSIGGTFNVVDKLVECYDLRTDSWKTIADLNKARDHASSCFHA